MVDDTHHKDQDVKRSLQPLIDTVTGQFVALDKSQLLFVCLIHGSLCIDKVSYFFAWTRQMHYTESCIVQYGYFKATNLTAFSIQLV